MRVKFYFSFELNIRT